LPVRQPRQGTPEEILVAHEFRGIRLLTVGEIVADGRHTRSPLPAQIQVDQNPTRVRVLVLGRRDLSPLALHTHQGFLRKVLRVVLLTREHEGEPEQADAASPYEVLELAHAIHASPPPTH
jgi:hypothetical protein